MYSMVTKDYNIVVSTLFLLYLKNIFFNLFLERGREGEREREKQQCVGASHMPDTGNLAHNPGMFPDWETNQWPFGSLNPLSHTSQGPLFSYREGYVCMCVVFEWVQFQGIMG